MYVAKQIYLRSQSIAIQEMGCPAPDEEIEEIEEIKMAYDKMFNDV